VAQVVVAVVLLQHYPVLVQQVKVIRGVNLSVARVISEQVLLMLVVVVVEQELLVLRVLALKVLMAELVLQTHGLVALDI
jgi:hypothetical protein